MINQDEWLCDRCGNLPYTTLDTAAGQFICDACCALRPVAA